MYVLHMQTQNVFTVVSLTCLLACVGLRGSQSYQVPVSQHHHDHHEGQQQQLPFRTASTHWSAPHNEADHELIDDTDDGGGGDRIRLTPFTFSSSGRHYHSTTTPHPSRRYSQPYFGQSSTRSGTSNVVPTVYHSAGAETTPVYSSVSAIRFPGDTDSSSSAHVNSSLVTTAWPAGAMARGGVHGGKHHQGGGGRRGKIPLNLLRQLSNEKDVAQIFAKYVSNVKVEDVNGQRMLVNLQGAPLNIAVGGAPLVSQSTTETTRPKIITGFSDRTIPKQPTAAAQRVNTYAGCELELQTVELPAPNDPSVVQYPRCVRLKRCGGCCASDLLSCESIMPETTEVQVQKFSYNDESEKLEYKETEIVLMSVDTSCRCNCRVKSRDCSARHEYSSDDCACICRNTRENELCLRQAHKLWDPNLCQCLCRETLPCSSGYSFDPDTCQCARIPEDSFGGSSLVTRTKRKIDTSAALRQRN